MYPARYRRLIHVLANRFLLSVLFPYPSQYPFALCFLLLALCVVGGLTASRFHKARRSIPGKLTKKDVRALIKDGLARSFFWVAQLFLWGCTTPIRFVDTKTRIALIICFVVAMGGAILVALMMSGRLPFLKQRKRMRTSPQSQQFEQVPLIEQQIRKRP